jgi:hypothetical protein
VCGFDHHIAGLKLHIAGLKLRSESFSGVQSFIGEITGPRQSAPRDLLHSLKGISRLQRTPSVAPTSGSRSGGEL